MIMVIIVDRDENLSTESLIFKAGEFSLEVIGKDKKEIFFVIGIIFIKFYMACCYLMVWGVTQT